ncbi:MAG TPA: formate dehydrogenase accessory protein FdhE [Bryobacteraceae bacterium]|nr:formate dehydrogenase accessory protein FdhE [Bryobacteraceae bacterium]
MTSSLDDRIARATELARAFPGASTLLNFYRDLAHFQKQVFDEVRSRGETDLGALTRHFPALIELVQRSGPQPLADSSSKLTEELLTEHWQGTVEYDPSGRFFARVLLQPYAEYLASRGDVRAGSTPATCPFCNARPVVAVLRGEGDGGKRSLLCSMCATEWLYRRVVCPSCGEENKDKLPIYVATELDYVRVDACDSCQTYLKAVDLTKNGHAVPVVDEIATVALNIWAEEHGYSKLEPNLLGM